MWTIKMTSRFKKDLKHYKNQPKKIEELETVLTLLKYSGTVPDSYNPHGLKGNYNGFMECHIEDDFLLIWFDYNNNVISLTRLGSHSELFK